MMESFTIDFERNDKWMVIRENEHLIQLMTFNSISTEVENAVLFKEDNRAVKTLLMADVPVLLEDQGYCEISEPAKGLKNESESWDFLGMGRLFLLCVNIVGDLAGGNSLQLGR